MVRLTRLFDILGIGTEIELIHDGNTIYTGTCGDCVKETWCCAYAEGLKYSLESARYIIAIRYL